MWPCNSPTPVPVRRWGWRGQCGERGAGRGASAGWRCCAAVSLLWARLVSGGGVWMAVTPCSRTTAHKCPRAAAVTRPSPPGPRATSPCPRAGTSAEITTTNSTSSTTTRRRPLGSTLETGNWSWAEENQQTDPSIPSCSPSSPRKYKWCPQRRLGSREGSVTPVLCAASECVCVAVQCKILVFCVSVRSELALVAVRSGRNVN